MAYSITGHVRDSGVPTSRTLYCYSSADGSLLGTADSDAGDGSYAISLPDATPVFVLAIPAAGELPQVMGPITPIAS